MELEPSPNPERLDRDEAREILEELARAGPPTARVAAIRVLLRMDHEEQEAEEPPSPFDDLYDLEPLAPRATKRR